MACFIAESLSILVSPAPARKSQSQRTGRFRAATPESSKRWDFLLIVFFKLCILACWYDDALGMVAIMALAACRVLAESLLFLRPMSNGNLSSPATSEAKVLNFKDVC